MYIIHLELTAFIEQHDGAAPIYVARWLAREGEGGAGGVILTSRLLAGYTSDGVLHLAHLPVERVSVSALSNDRPLLQQRLEQAHACLLAALPAGSAREGLLFAPDFWAELEQFPAAHDLWTWHGNGLPHRERRLIPRGEGDPAGA